MNKEKCIAEQALHICRTSLVVRGMYRRGRMHSSAYPEYEDFTQELVQRVLRWRGATETTPQELVRIVVALARNVVSDACSDRRYDEAYQKAVSTELAEVEYEAPEKLAVREVLAELMRLSPKLAHILSSRAHTIGSHADFAALVGRHISKLKPKQRQRVQALLARIHHIAGDDQEAV